MRRVWYLAAKDLLQTRRDRLNALFTIILPVAFTVFFGILLGGGGDGTQTIPLGLVDADGGAQAVELIGLLEDSEILSFTRLYDEMAADSQVEDSKVAAALLIPAGFTDAVEADVPVELTVIRTAGSTGAQSAEEAVRAALARLTMTRAAAEAAMHALAGAGVAPADGNTSLEASALEAVKRMVADPAIGVAVEDSGLAAGEIAEGFDQSSPGMLVNWILFSIMTAAIGLVMERRSGALSRLLTTEVTRVEIIAGKALAMFTVSFIQQIILIGLGQFAFGVQYLRDPVALLLVMVTLSAMTASLGLLIATLFKTEQAVVATTVILSMLLASTGGAWFPLEITGEAFSRVSHFLPVAWILDSFRGIILRGWGVGDVLIPLAVAWGYSVVFFGIAARRLRVL